MDADSATVEFGLLSLIRHTVDLDRVEGVGIRMEVRLPERDSQSGATAATAEVEDRDPSPWNVRGGEVELRGLSLSIWEGGVGAGPEEAWTLEEAHLQGRDLLLGSELAFSLDSLLGRFSPRGSGPSWGQLLAVGQLDSNGIRVDTLHLETPESRLSAAGTVPLRFEGIGPAGLTARVSATPLHIRDLGPFAPPTLPDSLRLFVTGDFRTSQGALSLDLIADLGTGGRMEARGRLSESGEGPDSEMVVQMEDLDLNHLGLSSTERRVNVALDARADSLRGTWAADWSTSTDGVEVGGTGNLRMGGRPSWGVEGRGSYLPTPGAPPLPGVGSSGFAIEFEGSGEGFVVDALSARGGIQVDSLQLGGAPLVNLSLSGEMEAGGANLLLTGLVSGGRLEARGQADLSGLPALEALVSVRLDSAAYGDFRVDSLMAEMTGGKERIAVRGSVFLPDTQAVQLGGEVGFHEDGIPISLDSLRFAGLNVQALGAWGDSTAVPMTRLSGKVEGSANILEGDWTARGGIRLDSSRVGLDVIRRGDLEVVAGPLGGTLAVDVVLAQGGVSGELRVGEVQGVSEILVPGVEFRHLDVGALLGRSELETRLSGSLEGRVRGVGPTEAVGNVALTLDSSRVSDLTLSSARLTVVGEAGEFSADLIAVNGGGVLQALGEGNLTGPRPRYSAQGSYRNPAFPLPGRRQGRSGSVFARFGLEGEGVDRDSVRAGLWMSLDSARWDDLKMDGGRLEVSASEGFLRLDTLTLDTEFATISGAGSLPLTNGLGGSGEVRVQGQITRAELLAPVVNAEVLALGEGVFSSRAVGTLDDLVIEGEGHITALLMDAIRAEGIDLEGRARLVAGEGVTEGGGQLSIDRLRSGAFPVRHLDAEATLEPDGQLAVEASAILDETREGRVSLRVEDLSGPAGVRVDHLEFQADEDNWTLQAPARITFADGVVIDSLSVRAPGQEIWARGRVAGEGPLDLALGLSDFRIGTLSDLAGIPALQGRLTGSLALSGTAGDPRGDLQVHGRLTPEGLPPSDLDITAEYAGGSLGLDATGRLSGGRSLRASGDIPFELSFSDSSRGLRQSGALNLGFSADSLPLDWIGLFLPSAMVRELDGTLDGNVSLRGTPGRPVLEGGLAVTGFEARMPRLGAHYRGGRARARFVEDRLVLDSLRLRSGDGVLRASGTVRAVPLDRPEYDVTLVADAFQAVGSTNMTAVVSGNVSVSGVGLRPVVKGDLSILRADLYLGEMAPAPDVAEVALTDEDYRELARVFGYFPPSSGGTGPDLSQGATLDLEVDLRRDSWVRQRSNPKLALQLSGRLSVGKEPGDSLRLVGEVEGVPRRSYVEQFGRRFSLTRGTLLFQGAPQATRVDVRAEYEVPSRDNPDEPEVVIALDINGTPDNLRLELSSSPNLEASDMVSYLAVGRPAGQGLGGGDNSLSQTGGGLALGRLSGAVEAYGREQVGLDVVEITTDGLEGVTLLAGRYLTPDLYMGVRQPVSLQRASGDATERTPDPEVELELQAARWLLLNLQAGGRTGVEFFLRSRIAYE